MQSRMNDSPSDTSDRLHDGEPTVAFGPAPSRRLGRSLGINNIFSKYCSYSCVYCQLGRTVRRTITPRTFFRVDRIVRDVESHMRKLKELGEPIDYLTFVANGEPTLDSNLGSAIDALRGIGEKIAVITNSSLLWREDVRANLAKADWVSVKIDAVEEREWRLINRPHVDLRISQIIDGLERFAMSFHGELVSETMLVQGINDGTQHVRQLAGVLSRMHVACSYLCVPIRPPAESWVRGPSNAVLSECSLLLAGTLPRVECLISEDKEPFTLIGSVSQALLDITRVHPMETKAVNDFLRKAGADWSVVERLVENGRLREIEFNGKRYYRKSN